MRLSSIYKHLVPYFQMNVNNNRLLLSLFVCCLFFSSVIAQRGKDGPKIISASNSLVNEYTVLLSDVSVGSIFLSVAGSDLNTLGLYPGTLSSGDLIMIIQMQGATIKIINDSSYGQVLNYNNCGNYEFCQVASVPNTNTITLDVPLLHNYTAAGRVQVIRVPRYSSLTIDSTYSVICSAWNGTSGGIVAIEVLGNTLLNGSGKIDVSGKGFRGGILNQNLATYGVSNFYGSTGELGAEKGEGIAGFEATYDLLGGRYCRGAPANGGGGGNAHNSGGGGGANGGDINLYTGKGCPDISDSNWVTAWNLEYNGMADLISSGGGRGGYTYSYGNENALVTGPNNASWNGDMRGNMGGLGGRPLNYSSQKIFIGGGGGAGNQNDSRGGRGGTGGGLIYLINAGTVSGSGQFTANGENGYNTSSGGNDGAGGGGGGGTVIINSIGAISGISISANGGNGGNQGLPSFNLEAEGPGAGGGGGYIAISNGSITKSAAGGNNGVTNSISLTEFPPNGATKGGAGTTNAVISDFYLVADDRMVCSGNSATLSVSAAGNVPSGIIFGWYNAASGGTLLGIGNTLTTPPLNTDTIYFAGSYPGRYRQAIHVNVDLLQANFSAMATCFGNTTTFTANATTSLGSLLTWNWNFGDSIGNSSMQNPVYNYASPSNYTAVLNVVDDLGCIKTDTENVVVYPLPSISFSSNVTSGCGEVSTQFSNNTLNGNTYVWNFGDGSNSSQYAPAHNFYTPGNYTISLSSVSISGCNSADSIIGMIIVNPIPIATFTASDVCLGDAVNFLNHSIGNGATLTGTDWNFGDGSGTSSDLNPIYFYSSAGTFNAELIVFNTTGCSDTSEQQLIVKSSPDVQFTTNSQPACDSFTVNITNVTNGAATYLWHFGDGDTSVLTNPSHLYAVPGSYTISLTAVSTNGCERSLSIMNMITIHASPVINISSSQNNVCVNNCIDFHDSSTGMNSSWSWLFPGAFPTSSLSQHPSNVCYTTTGNYPIMLTVSNGFCSSVKTFNNFINVTNCLQPHADFVTSDTEICSGSCINFISASTNASIFVWHFSGASPAISSDVNPFNICYRYPGDFDVTLITSNSLTSDTLIRTGFVHVFALPAAPLILQQADTLTIITSASHYQWYFEGIPVSGSDTPFYVAILPGNYSVEITDFTGCKAISPLYYFTMVGIPDLNEPRKPLVFPNPVSGMLHIRFDSNEKETVKIKIETILGTLLLEKKVNVVKGTSVFSMDVTNLASGIYFISLETSKGIRVEKFTRN